jgi:ribosome-associated translation inhibitor RaiA
MILSVMSKLVSRIEGRMNRLEMMEIAKKVSRRYSSRLDVDDIIQEASVKLLEANLWINGANEEFIKAIKRAADRLHKRIVRKRERFFNEQTLMLQGDHKVARLSFEVESREVIEIAKDDFERDYLRTLLGTHPQFDSLAKFFKTQIYFSRSAAYRHAEILLARIRDYYRPREN